jgi:GNAT superfamily N-acetyltransferase
MDETITLRQATTADAAAIRDLTRDAYAKWVPLIGREPRPMIADYDAAVRDHRFDLLYVGGALAALIETVDQGDSLLVENLAVAPDFQRRGLGAKLMAHAETVARSLGRRRLWLYTNDRFDGNVRLYARLGYRVESEEPIDGGMTRVSMGKTLAVALPQLGGCVCGAVRYQLNAAPLLVYACHCHDCQGRSGAAFTLPMVVRTADVAVAGPLKVLVRSTRSGREIEDSACATCRTPVFARARAAPDFMSLRAGTLDDADWVTPIVQTFVESAIPWAIIPGVRAVPWAGFDFAAYGSEWAKTAPEFAAAIGA